jgi:hypothetical protein
MHAPDRGLDLRNADEASAEDADAFRASGAEYY